MHIFISWSKEKSKEIAIETKSFLQKIMPESSIFVSMFDIEGGEEFQNKIIENIHRCDVIILIITKDNKKSPWMLFEAGYARALNKKIIPILFDNDPDWHSWIDNPMNFARPIVFDNFEFDKLLFSSLNIKNVLEYKQYSKEYRENILVLEENYRKVDVCCEYLVNQMSNNKAFSIESPYFNDKIAYFTSGFESNELFKLIVDNFLFTGKYLWIYGRKNMKLLSGSYANLFKFLHEKTTCTSLDSIDINVKFLFLNPQSKETKKAHIDQEIFDLELNSSILRARSIVGENDNLKKSFRMYSNKRDEIILRLDNCIIYSKPNFDSAGRPQILTNSSFEVFSIYSAKGQECIKKYLSVWENAVEFD